MEQLIHEFAQFLRQHLTSISVGIVATVLMIYGSYINGFFKKITRKMPFVARFALFIVLCSAGYAFISALLVRLFKMFLLTQADLPLIGILFGTFILLAILAYRGKEV